MRVIFMIIFLAFCQELFSDCVEEGLKRLSVEERIYLKYFFGDLVYYDSFGHVLWFENKPVCLIGLLNKGRTSYREQLPAKGWKVWKKNEHLFPHPNFIFCEEIIAHNTDSWSIISIINKKSLLNCLTQHEQLFKEILGSNFSPASFIAEVEERKQLGPLIANDEALLGILLGFGKESSLAFKEQTESITVSEAPIEYQCVLGDRPKKCPMLPMGFVGDPESEEVKYLLESYSAELKNLWNMYRGKDSLRLSLKKLCEKE